LNEARISIEKETKLAAFVFTEINQLSHVQGATADSEDAGWVDVARVTLER
jgi:hypothetical protein